MTTDSPLVLVDGSSYLFRAFHALPPLTNSNGEPTGAIHGVVNMLKRLLSNYPTKDFVVVFDAPGKTFRHDMYPEYKANRPPMPDDLRSQIEPLHAIVRAMGMPLLAISDVEADDVIGTLAKQASDAGRSVVISTGDKDMAQLVNEHVTLVNTMSDTLMDIEGVKEKFGVPPERIIDYLALMGDKVDNIPGVPSCGPKTAVKWLDLYGSLEQVMARADEVKGKIGEKLRAALPELPLSYQLATINCDVELSLDEDSLTLGDPDTEALRDLFTHLEMRSALRDLSAVMPDAGEQAALSAAAATAAPAVAVTTKNHEVVTDAERFGEWLARLASAPEFAFDTETTSLEYMKARVVGVSFAVEAGEAAYVPCGHDYEGAPEQLSLDDVLGGLAPLLADSQKTIIGQNLKYDLHVLANHGIEVSAQIHDTMLQSYMLDAAGSRHDMDTLAAKHLGVKTIKYEEVAGKGKAQLSFEKVPLDKAGPYAAEDADITLQLHHQLWPQLETDERLCQLYREVEIPLLRVLKRVEENGVSVDRDALSEMSTEFAAEMESTVIAAHEDAGEEFNLGSPKQIQAIFFEKKGLPVIRKTPKGQPSTAEDVLEQLAEDYELPRLILRHRTLSKLKSTYTDKLPLEIQDRTGRVHTSYHQAVASTGRLSSSEPNLQNIPVRRAEGRRIRQAFVASADRCLVAADYSQIELRIMAHLSQDAGLLSAFSNGLDVHSATAAEVFEVAVADVVSDQRRAAKAINFGLIYGMSAFGLAKQLDTSRTEAQEYIDKYFDRYPGVKRYMDETRMQAHEDGFVETVFGRRLNLPDINSSNSNLRNYAERTAINAPMQGTAADIIKKAMIAVDDWLQSNLPDALMVMQVHDELVFDVAKSDLKSLQSHVPDLMCDVAGLSVPLIVDVGVGDNWDEAH